jgi:hypothetical protein
VEIKSSHKSPEKVEKLESPVKVIGKHGGEGVTRKSKNPAGDTGSVSRLSKTSRPEVS